jgi:valyl-tRNA synthetase
MSKSLGNGIDPLEVVEKFGADALRWTCIANTALGADLILDPNDLETTFAPGRNFANKLWNIGQFVLSQLPKDVPAIDAVDRRSLTLADRWILSRAQATVREATASLEQFRLDEAAKRCFEFAWNELADWYVEAVKPRMSGKEAQTPQAVLAYCFDLALRLLHPVVPFITEELWQKLPGRKHGELLAVAQWPVVKSELEDPRADQEFARVKTAIEHIRSIRAEYRVPPKIKLRATIVLRGKDKTETFDGERDTIVRQAQPRSPRSTACCRRRARTPCLATAGGFPGAGGAVRLASSVSVFPRNCSDSTSSCPASRLDSRTRASSRARRRTW